MSQQYHSDIENVIPAEIDEKKVIKKRYATLYAAAVKGNWGKAEEIYKNYPDDVRAILGFSSFIQKFDSDSDSDSNCGDTALHVATAAGRNEFVQQLVSKYLKDEDIEMRNGEGNTAFCLAAMTGNIELALLMLEKNEKLAMIGDKSGMLPVQMAAWLGHEDMVKFLYDTTKNKLMLKDLIELLVILINNDLYDFALNMVKEFPDLAIARRYGDKQTALHALARKPMTIFNDLDNPKQGILKRFYNRRTNKIGMHPEARKLVEHLWENAVDKLDYYEIESLVEEPCNFVSVAAKEGNIDFLSVLFRNHPALMLKKNEDGYTIFHTAVLYRHKNIINLINKIPSMKDVIFALRVGEERNNILHLAAILPPDQDRLKVGAVFKMQQELLWFKGVRMLMPPLYAEAKNENGKTARTLFSENHERLMKDGEEWMLRTAESCMLVATIIVTVAFAAAITVPGGLKEDTGAPNFLKNAAFMFFAISNTISVASSSCSILIFLSIFRAEYAEEEFLWSLPRKLFLGVLTLFLSIVAMMAVFCAIMFIIFYDGTIWPYVLAVALAYAPVSMLICKQFMLLYRQFSFQFSFQNFQLVPSSNSNSPDILTTSRI